MPRMLLVAGLFAVAASVTMAPLTAQSIAGIPVRFGVTGGMTEPVGSLGGDVNGAWNVGGLVSLGNPGSRTSLRLDGQWARVRGSVEGFGLLCASCSYTERSTDFRVISTTADVVYNVARGGPTQVYVIGGVGAYNERGTNYNATFLAMSVERTAHSESVTRFGVNGGIGANFKLARHAAFIEARFHNLFGRRALNQSGTSGSSPTSFQYIPFNVGFIF
jgi:opacity protein-like surface antigen